MNEQMDIRTARALVRDEKIWPLALKRALAGGTPFFHDYPADDGSRLALLDAETRRAVARWLEVIARADELKGVVDGEKVRVLADQYEGAYPEALRFAPYFVRWHLPAAEGERILATAMAKAPAELRDAEPLEGAEVPLEAVMKLLKLKFPEACALCCS